MSDTQKSFHDFTIEDVAKMESLTGEFSFDVGLLDSALSGWYQGEFLYPNFPIYKEDVVVDIGCGDAGNLMYCGRRGAHVIAADMDGDKVNRQIERLKETSARKIEGVIGESNPLAIENETVTKLICTEVLEHVDDTAQFLSELVRIGKPGALYFITVPDPVQERLQKACCAPPNYFEKPNHIRIIERDEFPKMLEDAGLVVEHRSSFGFYWSIWFAFYWHCNSPHFHTTHPLAMNWAKTWYMFLKQPNFAPIREKLNELCPKSQAIIARKPL